MSSHHRALLARPPNLEDRSSDDARQTQSVGQRVPISALINDPCSAQGRDTSLDLDSQSDPVVPPRAIHTDASSNYNNHPSLQLGEVQMSANLPETSKPGRLNQSQAGYFPQPGASIHNRPENPQTKAIEQLSMPNPLPTGGPIMCNSTQYFSGRRIFEPRTTASNFMATFRKFQQPPSRRLLIIAPNLKRRIGSITGYDRYSETPPPPLRVPISSPFISARHTRAFQRQYEGASPQAVQRTTGPPAAYVSRMRMAGPENHSLANGANVPVAHVQTNHPHPPVAPVKHQRSHERASPHYTAAETKWLMDNAEHYMGDRGPRWTNWAKFAGAFNEKWNHDRSAPAIRSKWLRESDAREKKILKERLVKRAEVTIVAEATDGSDHQKLGSRNTCREGNVDVARTEEKEDTVMENIAEDKGAGGADGGRKLVAALAEHLHGSLN